VRIEFALETVLKVTLILASGLLVGFLAKQARACAAVRSFLWRATAVCVLGAPTLLRLPPTQDLRPTVYLPALGALTPGSAVGKEAVALLVSGPSPDTGGARLGGEPGAVLDGASQGLLQPRLGSRAGGSPNPPSPRYGPAKGAGSESRGHGNTLGGGHAPTGAAVGTAPAPALVPEIPLSAEVMDGSAGEVRRPLVVAWQVGSLLFLALLLRDHFAIWRVVRRSRRDEDGLWAACVRETAERLGRRRPPRVRITCEIAVPCVTGVIRPVLLVPEEAPADGQACRSIVAHELAHLKRRDMLWVWIASVTRALWWWHPLAWVLVRQLRRASEEACDDWAIRLCEHRADYAQAMLASAELACAPGVLAVGHRGNMLLARIRRVLSEDGTPAVRVAVGAVCAAAVISGSVLAATRGIRVGWTEGSLADSLRLNEQVLRELARSEPEPEQSLVAQVLAHPDSEAAERALVRLIADPESKCAMPAFAYALRSGSGWAIDHLAEMADDPGVAGAIQDVLVKGQGDLPGLAARQITWEGFPHGRRPAHLAHIAALYVQRRCEEAGGRTLGGSRPFYEFPEQLLYAMGESATPEMLAWSERPEPWATATAISFLGNLHPCPPEATGALLRLLGDNDPLTRFRAACALDGSGRVPPEAADGLAEVLRDRDKDPINALSALLRLGPAARPAVPAVRELLETSSGPVVLRLKSRALGVLAATGDTADTVPQLTLMLGDGDPWARAETAHVFARIGAAAEPARDRLRALLEDPDPLVRVGAAHAMVRLGEPEPAVGILMRLLGAGPDQSPEAAGAWHAIWLVAPEIRDTIMPAVLSRASDPDPGVRRLVPLTLRAMRATGDATADARVRLLGDPSEEVARESLNYFEDLDVVPASARRALLKLAKTGSWYHRVDAAAYLARVGDPEEAVAVLCEAAVTPEGGTGACQALAQIGAPAASAIPTLERVLDSPGDYTAFCAAVALRRIREAMAREGGDEGRG